jgi:hypothetical protein
MLETRLKPEIIGKLYEGVDFTGEQLRGWREGAGLSQEGLSERLIAMGVEEINGCYVCQQRIAAMEKMELVQVPVRVFKKLGAIFGMGIDIRL